MWFTYCFITKEGWYMALVCVFPCIKQYYVKNHYPLPRIYDLIHQLKDAVYFTNLDLRSGYHHIRITKGDIQKPILKKNQGLFELLVIPFELCNAIATFMHVMNNVLGPFLDEFLIVYLDDILIFSKSRE